MIERDDNTLVGFRSHQPQRDPVQQLSLEQQRTWLENHDANLFFADGGVSAVIDWDKAEIRSRGQEAIRAMQHSFTFEPALCQEFLAAYRSKAPLTDDDLDLAAEVYGHHRDCDLWLAETIFLDGDDRPKRFVTPGPFRPFTEIWKPVRESLAFTDAQTGR